MASSGSFSDSLQSAIQSGAAGGDPLAGGLQGLNEVTLQAPRRATMWTMDCNHNAEYICMKPPVGDTQDEENYRARALMIFVQAFEQVAIRLFCYLLCYPACHSHIGVRFAITPLFCAILRHSAI